MFDFADVLADLLGLSLTQSVNINRSSAGHIDMALVSGKSGARTTVALLWHYLA